MTPDNISNKEKVLERERSSSESMKLPMSSGPKTPIQEMKRNNW